MERRYRVSNIAKALLIVVGIILLIEGSILFGFEYLWDNSFQLE
jgi:hypothetical protein